MKRLILLFLLLCVVPWGNSYGQGSRGYHDRPVYLGPQYPLSWMTTRFEPDSAFMLKPGDFITSYDYVITNSWAYSANSEKFQTDGSADAKEFTSLNHKGYSVYVDGETSEQIFRLRLGLTKSLEFHYDFRQMRFTPGNLDGTIENFHNSIQVGNGGREIANRDKFQIHVYDNDEDELIFSMSSAPDGIFNESQTIGFKYLIKSTENESLTVKISSNYDDRVLETELNEIDATYDVKSNFHDFNDYNLTLNYSFVQPTYSIHAAASTTILERPLFEKSPKQLFYYFIGVNFQLFENLDFILQDLIYTSIFPNNTENQLAADLNELSATFRVFLSPDSVIDFGFVENYSQGPSNIDISFYTNFVVGW